MDKLKKIINRETILYVVFGGSTTVINWVVLFLLNAQGVDVVLANTIGWFFAVTFAYITNRIFVFKSNIRYIPGVLREIGLFFLARALSLVVENIGLAILCNGMHINLTISKIITSVVVIVMNYVLSKLVIFKSEGDK